MSPWRLIHTPPGDVAWVMAVDEALWGSLSPDDSPIIRLHDFSEESVTLGFAQSPEDLDAAGLGHLPRTRRLTGGGAIHHGRQTVSFSLIAFDPGGAKRPGPIARALGDFLVAMWRQLGVETCVAEHGDPATLSAPLCADRLYPGDVVCGETKIAGLAQRHRRGRLLVQAALMLERVTGGVGDQLAVPAIAEALRAAVAEQFATDLKPALISSDQRSLADSIREERSQPIPVTSGGAPSRHGPK